MSIKETCLELMLRMRVLKAAALNVFSDHAITPVGRLYATKISFDGSTTDYGLVSTKVVTDAGVSAMVSAFRALFTISDFKYHASGTGVAAEAAANTALGTEVGTRVAGTQVVGATANVYKTVATLTYGAAFAVTEHGLLSALTVGTLLDRSVFAAINVANGDSIEFTYELTLPSGS